MPPIVRKTLLYGCAGLLAAVVVAYAVDAAQMRVRLATGGSSRAYGTVTVLYAAALKGGNYEIYGDQPEKETCSRSLFPQMGYTPCWYLRRRPIKVIG